MGIETISAVSDSGPLIHLSEINFLSILSIFKGLHVPDAVWIETVVKERISERYVESGKYSSTQSFFSGGHAVY
ncbi:MAG: hypothetical protein KAI50_04820 [Desulfobacterales bacterium]|nr:hypothetical protein [Desulfobacterales bacterium]